MKNQKHVAFGTILLLFSCSSSFNWSLCLVVYKEWHYIPQLVGALLDHNEHSKEYKFNNKGVAIGNPLLRLDRDVPANYEYFWSHGMISDESVRL
uniref:Uncharacterized protein n=1 Tax=Solanum lycopersicum TaxID=4081 RepID=A0A3Q7IGV7_SOLLC